jgi:N-acetylglucosamine-6-phosphate deacetylase
VIVHGPRLVGADADWVRIEGGVVAELGRGRPPGPADPDLVGGFLVPGFVDLHVHGGAGASFQAGDPEEVARAVAFHRRHGTTTLLASLVSAPVDQLTTAVRRLDASVARGLVHGVHLEGPFLAGERRGAHDPAALLPPDRAVADALADAGPVAMVTLAPELPGAAEVIAALRGRGVVVAVGHTDATHAEGRAAFRAGATVATHLFNAMRPFHHREPGVALAALEDPRVVLELVNDGVHLHPAVVRSVFATAGARRIALVTDAMSGAGLPDGTHRLGSMLVEVRDGAPRLAGTDTIAGSALTMDAAVRRAVRAGVDLADAVRAATTTPAEVLGLTDRGRIVVGRRADLVHLLPSLDVRAVLVGGRPLTDQES